MAKHTLKSARVSANLRQTDVAVELDVNRTTIQNWENGITFPNAIQFAQLCRLYGVSMDDIFLPTQSA